MNWVQLLVGLSLAGLYLLYWVLGFLGVLVVVCKRTTMFFLCPQKVAGRYNGLGGE